MQEKNNNSMENEINEGVTPLNEKTRLLKPDESESRLQQVQKQIMDTLHVLQTKYQGAKIECRKVGEKILSIKIKKPNQTQVTILFLSIPALLDAIGYGILSFSQLLTTSYSLQIIDAEPEELTEPHYLIPLAILPISAAAGALILGVMKNIHNLEGFTWSRKIVKKKLKNGFDMFVDMPLVTSCLLIGALAESIIVYNNLGSSADQLGLSFINDTLKSLSIVFTACIGLQYVILNGPGLTDLIDKGYTVDIDYLNNSHRLVKTIMAVLVNVLPILGSATAGALAASESYELTQYCVRQFDKDDIADRIAWLPSTILGGLYFACHFALCGRTYKEFLAEKCYELNNSKSISDFLKKTVIPSSDRWLLKLILYPLSALIGLATCGIGFGALDEMSYIVVFSSNPTLKSSVLSLRTKLLAFAVPALSLALGTYAAEPRKLLKELNLISNPGQNTLSETSGDKKVIEKQEPIKRTPSNYSVRKLIPDIVSVAIIGGVKFLIDWVYMPDSVSADQLTLKDNILIAIIVGLMAIGRQGILSHYDNLPPIPSTVKEGKQEEDDVVVTKDNTSTPPATNSPTTTTMQNVIPNVPLTRNQFILQLAFIGALTTGMTMGSQLVTRYVFLDQSYSDEAMDRLNNAQVLGALIGGLTGVYGWSAAKTTYGVGKRFWNTCHNFFVSSQTNTDIKKVEDKDTQKAQTNEAAAVHAV